MAQWAYKVAYIDYRGRISCEGLETLRRENERRSAFVRRYMNTLGKDGWELVGIQPLTGNSAYYVFKRAAQEGDFAEEAPAASAQPAQPTGGPTVENA
jgi:dTDP-4-amino-4,6-dideoxygalactose transaminase